MRLWLVPLLQIFMMLFTMLSKTTYWFRNGTSSNNHCRIPCPVPLVLWSARSNHCQLCFEPFWQTNMLDNAALTQQGASALAENGHIVTKSFMDTFTVSLGGSGSTRLSS